MTHSIAAGRFSLPIGSELKFSNCLAFLYQVLELLKFLSSRVLRLAYKAIAYKKCVYSGYFEVESETITIKLTERKIFVPISV